MLKLLGVTVAATIAAWLILGTGAPADRAGGGASARESMDLPAVAGLSLALDRAESTRGDLVEEWIRLASVPASSGTEGARADVVEERMRAAGLEGVRRDAAGNVIGVIPGRDRSAKKVVFMAHMDTVAKPGADFTIRRDGDRLSGPGVRDDSAGLAALLAAARLARAAGIVPPVDTMIVASVGEELGLKGSQAFMAASGESVGAFVAVDGYLGQISYGATAIHWTKMHFRAKGAHTLKSHENPSATLAAAKAIEAIYAIDVPRRPEDLESWLNVGMLGGGEVPNAQARDAWFTVDLRSNDAAVEEHLDGKIDEACRRAAASVGVTFDAESLQRLEGARIEGLRDSKIVRAASAALDRAGWREVQLTPRGTADHNIAIQMGIPAIDIGVTTGDGAHTPDEFADVPPYVTGVKQLILMLASPLT
ncbi:MAG: M20/M25/M40 family metallo-hydrolase [Acidobacteria bacterium]|nr:M20/M25/M40 family metallo-hydrolase [Acidobacteriota bacterium]